MTTLDYRPRQIEETIIKFKKNRDFAVYLCYIADSKTYVVSREIPEALHQFRTQSVKEAEEKYKEYYASIRQDLEKSAYRKFYN